MATVRDFDIVFLEKVLIEGDIAKTIWKPCSVEPGELKLLCPENWKKRLFSGKKVSTGIWSNLAFQVCSPKKPLRTVTGPWPEKSETSSFHLHSKGKPKNRKSYRDRTVTGPWRDRDSPILKQQTGCVVHNAVSFK
jgi:hypothetical protein